MVRVLLQFCIPNCIGRSISAAAANGSHHHNHGHVDMASMKAHQPDRHARLPGRLWPLAMAAGRRGRGHHRIRRSYLPLHVYFYEAICQHGLWSTRQMLISSKYFPVKILIFVFHLSSFWIGQTRMTACCEITWVHMPFILSASDRINCQPFSLKEGEGKPRHCLALYCKLSPTGKLP